MRSRLAGRKRERDEEVPWQKKKERVIYHVVIGREKRFLPGERKGIKEGNPSSWGVERESSANKGEKGDGITFSTPGRMGVSFLG